MTAKASPPDWKRFTDAADAALDHGRIEDARSQYEAALAVVLPAKLWLLDAELTRREGRPDRALHLLRLAEAAHPGNFWPTLKRAELLLAQGRAREAAEAFDRVHSLDGAREYPGFLATDLDLRMKLGDMAGLARSIETAAAHAPVGLSLVEPLAALAALPGGIAAAAPLYYRLLEADPENTALRLDYTRLLSGPCPPEALIAGMRLLMDSGQSGDEPPGLPLEIGLPLARAHRQLGQSAEEEDILLRLAARTPTAPALLRHLHASQMASADAAILSELETALAGRVSERLHAELAAQAALATGNAERAVKLLRGLPGARKAPHEAQLLATALIAQGRYDLALRYLRRCTRRWPGAPGLATFRIVWALKLGQFGEAEQAITAGTVLGEADRCGHLLMLAGMRNDVDAAMTQYARLREAGNLTQAKRLTMTKLLYSLADFTRLDEIRARIGDPLGETGSLLHRSGLAGAMALEMQLEERDYRSRGGYDKVEDWRHTRPESVIAAIRVIDKWRGSGEHWTDGPVIPRRIFQYWDKPDVPPAVRDMSRSWAEAAGFAHELWSRQKAISFLRENFGPKWVRAFELARNPAEESDLLRLCLLVQYGGIWADADDHLYGNLSALVDKGPGLIVYREALGGTIGNNLLAAPPKHPVLIAAAQMVRQNLLARNAETAWGKTGPGVLTRCLAHYLVQVEIPREIFPVTILDNAEVSRVVAMHNPVRYKTLPDHWAKDGARQRPSKIWPTLLEALKTD